ncbi:MAG: hypothetical protein D3923_05770, partial [Candidatus Electrothrix sp. AR3]|nr:hypothetical protein [Candidatus Electrothrix sp. AR3]
MKKVTIKIALGMTVVALALASGNVSAENLSSSTSTLQEIQGGEAINQMALSLASSAMNMVPGSPAPQPGVASDPKSQQVDLKEIVGEAIHTLPAQQRDKLTEQMIGSRKLLLHEDGTSALTQQDREQLSRSMISRNMPLLKELNGTTDKGTMDPDAAAAEVMGKIRDQIMKDSYANISQF